MPYSDVKKPKFNIDDDDTDESIEYPSNQIEHNYCEELNQQNKPCIISNITDVKNLEKPSKVIKKNLPKKNKSVDLTWLSNIQKKLSKFSNIIEESKDAVSDATLVIPDKKELKDIWCICKENDKGGIMIK